MAKVQLTTDAKEDLRRLDGEARVIVAKGLKKLESDPKLRGEPLGSRNDNNLTGYRKLVVGKKSYRIVYRVHTDGTVCIVHVIGKHSDDEVYRIVADRLARIANQPLAAEIAGILERLKDLG